MVWLPAVLLVALASTCARAQQRETCYANDVDPYVKFATKTAYEFVNEKTNTQQHIIPNCEPIMFWSLNRHGARLPNPTNMMELPRLENFKRNVLENYNSGSVARNSNAFTRDELKRLEYIEDLKSYYTTGYGSPLNAKIGCGPVKDMVNFFGKYVNSPFTPPQPKASIQFTDSAMLLLTLTAMGAYQDTIPLTGDNFHTPLIENRKWRTSDIDPFSANIVAVLYSKQMLFSDCEPIMFWSLNRHGARLPNPTNMMELPRLENFKRNVLENYNSGSVARNSNVRICRADLMNLEHWRWMPNHNMSFAGDLTSQGYMDTQNIARTWRSKFPNIMTNDPNDYLPLKHCPTWTKAVERNNDTLAQVNIFISKEEFKTMVANVSSRLGFAYLINNKDVEHMYEMCRLNKAWDITQPSAWCAAFTRDELKRLEYIEDLKSYYTTGYGSPLNAKIGCGPVKDMVNFFGKYVNSPFTPPQPKASIQFTDSAMLLLTLTAMGAYQDTIPLTGDNFHTPLIENRKWRTSDIDPFSANIVAVLYRCRDNGEQFRVMFFLNERPMMLNGCAVGLCDWSWVKSTYGHVADKCDLKFCNSGSAVKHISLLLVVSAFLGAVINLY